AEEAVNEIAHRLGNTKPCRTADEVLPPPNFEHRSYPAPGGAAGHRTDHYWLGKHLAAVEAEHAYGDLICECELVTRERMLAAINSGASNLDDVRRDVRMGMGPCQGGWCIYRTTALLYEQRAEPDGVSRQQALADGAGGNADRPNAHFSIQNANAAPLHFLQERWKGMSP